MDIEHFCILSWFCGHESHEQDGERLRAIGVAQPVAASGDPAMTFMSFMRRTLIVRGCSGLGRRHCGGRNRASAEKCAPLWRADRSAADSELLDQALVAAFIDALEI